jgi:hypothetical protein
MGRLSTRFREAAQRIFGIVEFRHYALADLRP